MDFPMTSTAQRNNIKRLRVIWVVVLFCWFTTRAFQTIWTRNFSSFNCVVYSFASFSAFRKRIFCIISPFGKFAGFTFISTFFSRLTSFALTIASCSSLTFFALAVAFTSNLTFFALPVLIYLCFSGFCLPILRSVFLFTIFTLTSETVFGGRFLIKIIGWLNFFAMTASFCYDCLRHGFFLINKLCLEPSTARTVVGSSYYTTSLRGVK